MSEQHTPTGRILAVTCDHCGGTHPAEYSHEGQYSEGPIFVVYCPEDVHADYYTTEALHRDTRDTRDTAPTTGPAVSIVCSECGTGHYQPSTHLTAYADCLHCGNVIHMTRDLYLDGGTLTTLHTTEGPILATIPTDD